MRMGFDSLRLGGRQYPPVGASTVNARWDNLVAGWHLDEASDGSVAVTRADILGTYDLTDNNTTASASGLISNAASFVGTNSESLTRASFVYPDEYTVALWTKRSADLTGQNAILSCYSAWTANTQLVIYTLPSAPATDPFAFRALYSVDGATYELCQTAANNQYDTWYNLVFTFNGTTKAGALYVNAGSANNPILGATVGTPDRTAATLQFANGPDGFWDGLVDETYIFSDLKDADWRTDFYNAGSGVAYPN